MLETYYAGAYWGVRPESSEECAEHALLFFERLKQIDPAWVQWYRAGKAPRGVPGVLVNVEDKQELEELFQRGRNRTDVGRKIIEDLGFSIVVWTPERKNSTMVRIHCGVYTPFSGNSCRMEMPAEGTTTERLLNVAVMRQVVTSMVMAWEPDWGIATSHDLRELIPRRNRKEYPVGWLMYCSNRQGRVPPLPAPVRIDRLHDEGTLITLTDERFTASNPEHVALAVRVHELLDRAGVLTPRQEPSSNP
jgi:hypothetical protein